MVGFGGHAIDLIACAGRVLLTGVGGRHVHIAIGIGQEASIRAIGATTARHGRAMGIGDAVLVVVDAVTRFKGGFTREQHGLCVWIPFVIHRPAIGCQRWASGGRGGGFICICSVVDRSSRCAIAIRKQDAECRNRE